MFTASRCHKTKSIIYTRYPKKSTLVRCFDEVFGELVDDLVAVLGDDALVVLDGDLLADVAELVHEISLGRRP